MSNNLLSPSLNVEAAVRERYSKAAQAQEQALCCPVEYNKDLLKVIPQEVIERDYGCGDPSAYLQSGETVLDLGSGGGKICFIAAQIVGAEGRVIGVDMNDDMLQLARRASREVTSKVGFSNTEFRKAKIQDLALDRERVDNYLRETPVRSEQDLQKLEMFMTSLRKEAPLIADNSVDVVVSNCVLNLVDPSDKQTLFQEIFRVLRRGGRAVISDIVADEAVPEHLTQNPELWSGCISGAYEEAAFLKAFERAGFYGVSLLKRDTQPWRTVEGIEFRAVTVVAYKGKEGECWEHNEALIYKGPFKSVSDDDGHTFPRGERIAVCRKTFGIFSKAPYAEHFYAVSPREEIQASEAKPFACTGGIVRRPARASKGLEYNLTSEARASACDTSTGCC